MFSTGLMTQLLAHARQTDDFRFAAGRRAVRLWSMHVAADLLGLEQNQHTNQNPLAEWRNSVPEANLSGIDQSIDQLVQTAQALQKIKHTEAINEQIAQLHAATKAATDAITAEEARVLTGGQRMALNKATPSLFSAKPPTKKAALPAPSRHKAQEWAEF